MLNAKFQSKVTEKKSEVFVAVTVLLLVGGGFILGRKYQRVLTAQNLKDVMTLTKSVNPMFPNTMPIAEIKEALSHIDGATFMDALVTNVDGVQSIITRF